MMNTLGKDFLQLLRLKVCETFLLRQNKKAYSILWSALVFLAFLEKSKKILFIGSKFSFPYVDF